MKRPLLLAFLALAVSPARTVAQANVAHAPPPADRVRVPQGPFTMGADRGGESDEHPSRRVTLGPFEIDRLEVTNEAYVRALTAVRSRPSRRSRR